VRIRLILRGSVTLAVLAFASAFHSSAQAQQKPNDAPSQGQFSQLIPIEVPAFRGLEPRLALAYSSEGRSGFAGVGWGLTGFSSVVRTKGGRGVPRFDATDVFILDGQELVACPAGSPSPGCAAGGSHATKDESYLRIKFEASTNSWKVWGRDGTLTVLTAVYTTASGTLRWGQTSTTDTHDNTSSYAWACVDGDCYPDRVTFGPYSVRLYRESRSDVSSFATGSGLGWTRYRLRSVLVARQGTPIRAYRLTYGASAVTGRSVLATLQQFGNDVAIDAAGLITGGTSLPARSFAYQGDPLAGSLRL
jgi:Salmonella virulence plasmid 65kDa B protein